MPVSAKDIQTNLNNVSSYLEQLRDNIEDRSRLTKLKLTPSQADNLEIVEVLSRIKRTLTFLNEDIAGDNIKRFGPEYSELVEEFRQLMAELASDAYLDASEYEYSKPLKSEDTVRKSVRFKDYDAEDDENTQMRNELMGTATNNFKPYRDEEDRNTLLSVDTTNQELFAQHQQQMLEQDQNLDLLHRSIVNQHSMGVGIGQELDEHLIVLGDLERGADQSLSRVQRATTGVNEFRRKVAENGSLTTIIVLTVILILLLVVLN
ncbi:hypothetical protein PUMCH_001848 [Australozyma saopauloensis]|uniref:t-SNARE coiled-coil homology domain-containing protein n=1 Tax=Australozyma saopauloensis TaxID=291208 RepID=A0AAX4H842_9ASCO|nr:hypothetical protein PUMCH_001848 [[Candida] saopauloensis]